MILAAPKKILIEGPDIVAKDQQVQFSCTVDGGEIMDKYF